MVEHWKSLEKIKFAGSKLYANHWISDHTILAFGHMTFNLRRPSLISEYNSYVFLIPRSFDPNWMTINFANRSSETFLSTTLLNTPGGLPTQPFQSGLTSSGHTSQNAQQQGTGFGWFMKSHLLKLTDLFLFHV
jgi:hypothetical protein